MSTYISNKQIRSMSFNQLAAAVTSGKLSEKRLRDYYSSARKTAIDRGKRVEKSRYGEIVEQEHWTKTKNLTTTSSLLHEISDVNRYLNRSTTTISGLKEAERKYIERAQEHKLPVDAGNYIEWIKFMQWFRNSEYALSYDSDSEEVEEVFTEGSSPIEWERLFEQFIERDEY